MPEQGIEGLGELLGDLYRELSPIVRNCMFGGMGVGFLATAGWFVLGPSTDILLVPTSIRAGLVLLFLFCLPTVFCGFVGCFVGVALEFLIKGKDEPSAGKRKPKRRRR
jgi:hypothetical protein